MIVSVTTLLNHVYYDKTHQTKSDKLHALTRDGTEADLLDLELLEHFHLQVEHVGAHLLAEIFQRVVQQTTQHLSLKRASGSS